MDDVKEKVSEENITDHVTIVNIINDYSTNYNINITDSDVEKLADTIEQVQSVQDEANAYQDEISDFINNSDADSIADSVNDAASDAGFSLESLFGSILSIFNINI